MKNNTRNVLSLINRWGWITAAILWILLSCIYILSVPARLLPWFSQPFLGTFIEPGMTVAEHGTMVSPEWLAAAGRVPDGSQLVELEGEPVSSPEDIQRALTSHSPGDQVAVGLVTPSGEPLEFRVTLSEFTPSDRLIFFQVPLLASLLFLGCALWVLFSGWKTPGAANLAICNASIALACAGFFDVYSTHQQLAVWVASIALGGGSLLHVALNYPDHVHLPGRWGGLRFAGYVSCGAVVLMVIIRLWGARSGPDFLNTLRMATIYAVVCLAACLAVLTFRHFKSFSPYERDLSLLFLIASLLAFMPVTVWWIADTLAGHIPFQAVLLFPAAAFPLVSGYTIQHTHSLDTDYRVMRIGTYALIAVAGGLGYALLVSGIGLLWITYSPINSLVINGVVIFLLALIIHPLRRAALTRIEPFILHSERAFQDRIQTFSRELSRLDTLSEIERVFRLYIEDSLHPDRMMIFLYDRREMRFTCQDSDLVFPGDSPLATLLAYRNEPFILDHLVSIPPELYPERSRLALLNLNVYLPMAGREHLAGWIALSLKRSGDSYTSRELAYLESLCDRVALTIERAVANLELHLRVRELDALAALSRAVSNTITLDDLAGTIYRQIISAFPAQDFRLVIVDPVSQERYRDLFRVEDNQFIPVGDGSSNILVRPSLEVGILNTGEALLCDDYTRECVKRGVMVSTAGVYSWMGAPLKINEQVIGAIFVGSRNPAFSYSLQQLDLLQSFASQVAGSIQKTNLLAQTQKQTEQLSALNDLGHQIVSTLDLDLVLESTLAKAVNLINGEAGSLLLLDNSTGELVFRTATGPVGSQLIGKRIPQGTGIAGKAMQNRQAVVVNDVHLAPEWLPSIDESTGFATRALVAAPLLIKGQPTGIIEIINSQNGANFSEDDLHMLSLFSAQASLAIDNARLYSSLSQDFHSMHQSRSEFISLLSHELKNPMTSIHGYAELLGSGVAGEINDQQASFLATIQANVERMNRLVTSLNDLAKMEGGSLHLEPTPVPLAEVLPAAMKSIRGTLDTRRAKVLLPPNLENLPPLLCDRDRLVQILADVLHNAAVYAPVGGCITIEAAYEEPTVDENASRLHLVITDQGPGIAPEDEQHLFEKYFRSTDPRISETPGIGLSLYLARALLEKQSGQIWFEKAVPNGAAFHIRLPSL